MRNALSAVACSSEVDEVLRVVTQLIGIFAFTLARDGRKPLRRGGKLRVQAMVDWALVCGERDIQDVSDVLWRQVLLHHREAWDAETRRLFDLWNDPAFALDDLRRRLQDEEDAE